MPMKDKRKILITGGNGRLGKALRQRLPNSDYSFYIASRCPQRKFEIQYDPVAITDLIIDQKIDTLVHLSTCYGRDGESTSEVYQTNVQTPLQVVNQLQKKSYNLKCIFADTFYQYSNRLNYEFKLYSQSKRIFEKKIVKAGLDMPMHFIKIKNVVGGISARPTFIEDVLGKILIKKETVTVRSPNQLRDFVHIDDVTTSFEQIIKQNFQNKLSYSIAGTGELTSIGSFLMQVLNRYSKITGDHSVSTRLILNTRKSGDDYNDVHYQPQFSPTNERQLKYRGTHLHERLLRDIHAI